MGKGDRKSRRGKIFRGSYGNTRPKKKEIHGKRQASKKDEAQGKENKTDTSGN